MGRGMAVSWGGDGWRVLDLLNQRCWVPNGEIQRDLAGRWETPEEFAAAYSTLADEVARLYREHPEKGSWVPFVRDERPN